jgi:hypothetical protein
MASHTIQKITLAYDEREDRLRLDIQEADGQLLTLWLTRRLADRLARALVEKLDSRLAATVTRGPLQAASLAALQEWEQSAALAQYQSDTPVRVEAPGLGGLIESIDLGHRGEATVLVFRWPAGHDATVAFEAAQLRQWLDILYKDYGRAQWPTEGVWPAWLAQAPAEAMPSAVNLMH